MTTMTTSPHPEQGQMVSVRSRNWMVMDVSASLKAVVSVHAIKGSRT